MNTTSPADHTARHRDTGSSVSGATPIVLAELGVITVAAAFVALIAAGIAAGEVFSTSVGASDRGIWMATQAWATPLALTGLAAIFAGAIPLALRNVRSTISFRRDAMAEGLPKILHTPHTTTNNTTKENVR